MELTAAPPLEAPVHIVGHISSLLVDEVRDNRLFGTRLNQQQSGQPTNYSQGFRSLPPQPKRMQLLQAGDTRWWFGRMDVLECDITTACCAKHWRRAATS
ncbi:MAG: hypothetical protein RL628_1518 [Actinomycetota bacterium]